MDKYYKEDLLEIKDTLDILIDSLGTHEAIEFVYNIMDTIDNKINNN